MRAFAATTLASSLSLISCARVYEDVQLRSGVTRVSEPATDGGDGHLGYDIGLHLAMLYKLDRCWSAGGAAAIDLASHSAAMSPATVQYAGTGPRAMLRRELGGRFAVSAWAGYDVLGFRAITEPRGDFAGTVSSVKLRGSVFGSSVLARFPFAGGELEAGPFFDATFLHAVEDEGRTPFNEGDMPVRQVTFGLVIQAAFGSLP